MKQYFISYVLQEEGKQDIFGNSAMHISGKIKDYQEVQSKLQDYVNQHVRYEERNRKLIILNIVKL